MADPRSLSRVEYGKWCVETAVQVVDATTSYCRSPDSSPFVEPAAYVLFVAISTLIVASSFTQEKDKILSKVHLGLWLMSHVSCCSYGLTTTYLETAQVGESDISHLNLLTSNQKMAVAYQLPLDGEEPSPTMYDLPAVHNRTLVLPQNEEQKQIRSPASCEWGFDAIS